MASVKLAHAYQVLGTMPSAEHDADDVTVEMKFRNLDKDIAEGEKKIASIHSFYFRWLTLCCFQEAWWSLTLHSRKRHSKEAKEDGLRCDCFGWLTL